MPTDRSPADDALTDDTLTDVFEPEWTRRHDVFSLVAGEAVLDALVGLRRAFPVSGDPAVATA